MLNQGTYLTTSTLCHHINSNNSITNFESISTPILDYYKKSTSDNPTKKKKTLGEMCVRRRTVLHCEDDLNWVVRTGEVTRDMTQCERSLGVNNH